VKGKKSSILSVPLGAPNVCELTIDGGSYTSVASLTLIDKLQLPTKVQPPTLFNGLSSRTR